MFVSIIIFAGEVVHITVLARRHTKIENADGEYQCYRSAPDDNATLAFGRTAPITSNTHPPADSDHQKGFEHVRAVTFSGSSWKRDGYGPFFCEGKKAGRDDTKVTTFFMRNDGR